MCVSPLRAMKPANFLLVLAASLPLMTACAVDSPPDEETDADEAELAAAGQAIIGAYERSSGDLRALVLSTKRETSSKNHFFAIVQTNIVCDVGPCPGDARVEGTWSATKTQLTLNADS